MVVPAVLVGVGAGVALSGAVAGGFVAVKKRRKRQKLQRRSSGGDLRPDREGVVERGGTPSCVERRAGYLHAGVVAGRSRGASPPHTPRNEDRSDAESDASGLGACGTASFRSCGSFKTCVDADLEGDDVYALPEALDGAEYLAFPSCRHNQLHDFGFSAVFKSCQSCGARPIRNRGCRVCSKVMCPTCFEAHKELRVTTVELAQAAIVKYAGAAEGRQSLLCDDYNALLADLLLPTVTQMEYEACCTARGSDPHREGINEEHLIILLTFLTPNASEALARAARRTIESENCRGDEKMHDWGPGVAICAMCGSRPILNRGCRSCNKRICGKCFPLHQRHQKELHDKKRIDNTQLVKSFVTATTPAMGRNESLQYPNFTGSRLGQTFVSRKKSNHTFAGHAADADRLSPPSFAACSSIRAMKVDSTHTPYGSPGPAGADIMPFKQRMDLAGGVDEEEMRSPASPASSHDGAHAEAPSAAAPSVTVCNSSTAAPTTNGSHAALPTLGAAQEPCRASSQKDAPASPENVDAPPPTPGVAIPANMGNDIPTNSDPRVQIDFDFFRDPAAVEHLSKGGALYYFTFLKGTQAASSTLNFSNILINISSFADEQAENGVPHVDPYSKADQNECIFMLNKATYLLGDDVKLADITSDLIASKEYQAACQPGNVKLYDTPGLTSTFRFKKTVIWPVYSITIQFKVSVLDPAVHPRLAELNDGLPVHLALLLERTKRNKGGLDVIKKAKSILLYHEFPNGGILVTNVTTGAATSVPSVIASMVDKLGSIGAKDVSETAVRTRKFFKGRKK
eukprot:TRINITY_DN1562_c0_g1_i1.p1 TRINITY_DN1562_c0_g1~~TRINITY_DN1562_c0_g1_i1.p1  ORF type:complete len:800 (+),score=248.80 TRINITY_DN1562_c0_g1_i1:89-2488(+)